MTSPERIYVEVTAGALGMDTFGALTLTIFGPRAFSESPLFPILIAVDGQISGYVDHRLLGCRIEE
ncbi:hypothetical protein [Nitrolancea hollandica]|uniref:Uncharacterized protein n=1 Tax=Nitrolancea hollandica Lb TaxID=1129897 RepID=I4EH62_9BACT|nr:hypothetical protein [Nitrolancea hollandica]CCF84024.1 exported hypothetical protein [Nitrolancea hollandica Lb]